MKKLKFKKHLSELILKGKKTNTWRLFDEKNLSVGDDLILLVAETGEEFSRAKIIDINETTFGKLTDDDWYGHEKYKDKEKMYKDYSEYYDKEVDKNTKLKIVKFKLVF